MEFEACCNKCETMTEVKKVCINSLGFIEVVLSCGHHRIFDIKTEIKQSNKYMDGKMKFEIKIDTDLPVLEVKIALEEQLRTWFKFNAIQEWDVKILKKE